MAATEPSPGLRAESEMATSRTRLRIVAGVFALAFASIGLRLVDMAGWTSGPGIEASVLSEANAAATEEEADSGVGGKARADIVDRNGEVLATTIRVPSIFADPSVLTDRADAAHRLASVLRDVDETELRARLEKAKRFAWVKHRITPEEQRSVLELGLPGVGFRYGDHRVYPKGDLASHVVGYVDIDNNGLAGVERSQQARLQDGDGPLALSLDLRVQQIVRSEVIAAYTRFRAKGADGIVLDRQTGEVLSMVSLPDYDPNRVEDPSAKEYQNRNVGGTYELGSLFKIITVAMALDSGKVTLKEHFDATMPLRIGRFTIRDDHAKKRWLSVPEIFMYSSNIGTAKMAFAAGGAEALQSFFQKLGFFAAPSLEIVEVAKPQTPRRWADVTTATTSFGHGFAITPIQFVEAVGGLIGDGSMAPTTLLRRDPEQAIARKKLVSAATADELRFLMWLTVAQGTGTRAKLDSYALGGKTGTAEKPARGGYRHDAVLASFVGAFPIQDPRYVVLVMLDEPQGDASTHGYRYGGWTSAPVVARIIDRIGPLLGVPPTPKTVNEKMEARLVAGGYELQSQQHE